MVLAWGESYLEIKRTSITRLKLTGILGIAYCATVEEAWNQKNLDYEIETIIIMSNGLLSFSWNQKNLDYEIETDESGKTVSTAKSNLKSKEPRLRDWNWTKSQLPWETELTWNQKNLDYEIETSMQ